jgi:zinc/manganese transport system permease protein
VSHFLTPVFSDGFFDSASVRVALLVGAVVAIVAGAVGTFTVLRGQSFAGHAFGDMSTMGSSAAFLLGIGPLWGLLIVGVAAAAAMETIGIQRARGRDLATGIVLGAGLGLGALFIYLVTTTHSTTGVSVTILFGSVFATPSSTIPLVLALSAVTLAVIAMLYRPLLLSSISPELAAARGIPVRTIGVLYLLALAVAVALTALTIGTILSTAMLIGPAATALRLTRRPLQAIVCAALLGIAAMWIGIVLAYDSFLWPPTGNGWPVSFFVTTLILLFYLLSGLPRRRRAPTTTSLVTDVAAAAVVSRHV